MDNRRLINPPTGPVEGHVQDDGVIAFLGIPFAEPPVGALRFQPPQPRAPWTEPLRATAYGPTAPQRASDGPLSEVIPTAIIPGDDYLNLNVWTPDTGASLPVMVFVHGGSWTSGSGAVAGYDGSRFARDGVVLVTINYRIGADGFAWFGDGAANLGLLDQIVALEWVRDNIAAFGGDPSTVTVFGESAGGMSVGALLAMPAASGLFHRAIMESGSVYHAISAESARLVADRLADILGVGRSREALATVPVERLLDAQAQVANEASKKPRKKLWGDVALNGLPFEPVIDGASLPALPIDAVRAGASQGIDVLVGSNAEEGMIAFAPSGVDKIKSWILYPAAVRTGLPGLRAVRTYRDARPDARPVDLLSDMLTDRIYRIPAIRLAEAHPGTYVYEFAWRSPAFDNELGACHGVELPFVFDNLDSPDWAAMTGGAAPQALADTVHRAWVDFARTGDPGWPAYTPDEREVMRFDVHSSVLRDPAAATRTLWEGRR